MLLYLHGIIVCSFPGTNYTFSQMYTKFIHFLMSSKGNFQYNYIPFQLFLVFYDSKYFTSYNGMFSNLLIVNIKYTIFSSFTHFACGILKSYIIISLSFIFFSICGFVFVLSLHKKYFPIF